jgi:hypothetical protein
MNLNLHNIQNHLYDFILYITWILYIAIALGLSASAPQYLDTLNYYFKIYVSLFLILRFNPLRQVTFTELDGKIAFSAGMFLLTSTAMNEWLNTYFIGSWMKMES